MRKKKVLVALSGGVDSSMAALLLKQKGYDLIGITLKVYDDINFRYSASEKGIHDASLLTDKLKIPFYVIDICEEFELNIIQYFVDEYSVGRTPNPCALCNYTIKWNKLIKLADEFGCDFVATGHYANINKLNERYFISEASDDLKDQSYFLWRLSQEYLKRTIFPLGQLTKKQIKEFAMENGFAYLAKKSESYNICFIPDSDYREFLKTRITSKPGNIILENGEIVGKHSGIWNYTIGQKKGIEQLQSTPLRVMALDDKKNNVVVGNLDKLHKNSVLLDKVSFMKYIDFNQTPLLKAKINYKSSPIDCIPFINESKIELVFRQPVTALTPGQSIVLYQKNDLVAGGVVI